MYPSQPSWGVVATVCEPAALLVAFAAHHLNLGAARVHFYLDAPNPELRGLVGHDPRVHLVDCSETFYRETLNRRRPPGINRRQIVNAGHAETVTDVEWLFHLDADEYLMMASAGQMGAYGGANPAAELARLPVGAMAFQVPNGERVFTAGAPLRDVFGGNMALPIPDSGVLARLRGPDMNRYSRHGLLGHTLGKSAIRVGYGQAAGIHAPKVPGHQKVAARDVILCHFDALTRLHWAAKMMRHIDNNLLHDAGRGRSDYRTEQLRAVRDAGGDLAAVEALHDRMRVIPPRVARKMRARGWMMDTGVAPGEAIARQYPGMQVDLSIAGFDARLLAQFPQLSATVGQEQRRNVA